MKIKKITPQSLVPVKRENVATVATVSRDGSAIAPGEYPNSSFYVHPFAGDDAE
ncbi:MAG: anacyclamide/piricyclamide family prenylated cyclic peptide [Symploca sp. SIO1B1]|nr:anacyclamide/piricyclamide family prenylated cyclic peptide [Symploca sp. SIO1B1]